jgi:hypothetical protein
MMSDQGRTGLLARRIPHSEVVVDRAYVIHARNGGVGIATSDGYLLRRVKFDRVYLDKEIDWQNDTTYGTAIPLQLIEEPPPMNAWRAAIPQAEQELLAWLYIQEQQYAAMIKAAWDEVLGYVRR